MGSLAGKGDTVVFCCLGGVTGPCAFLGSSPRVSWRQGWLPLTKGKEGTQILPPWPSCRAQRGVTDKLRSAALLAQRRNAPPPGCSPDARGGAGRADLPSVVGGEGGGSPGHARTQLLNGEDSLLFPARVSEGLFVPQTSGPSGAQRATARRRAPQEVAAQTHCPGLHSCFRVGAGRRGFTEEGRPLRVRPRSPHLRASALRPHGRAQTRGWQSPGRVQGRPAGQQRRGGHRTRGT